MACQLDVTGLSRHVSSVSGPSLLVGAGGSLSAAEFGRKLFDQEGNISQALTPLEFLQSNADLRRVAVFILTASGNNKDVLSAYAAAQARDAKSITVICASMGSKVSRHAKGCDRTYVMEFRMPFGKDGYLATNSLVATCTILARAFGKPVVDANEVAQWLDLGRKGFADIGNVRNYVLLYSGWGKPVAVDMESKLSEAGIAPSMPADFRHFAHGRHNWLDKQAETGVIAFNDCENIRLATSTLAQLPGSIPVWRCHSPESGSRSSIQLLIATFGFVEVAGKAVGIDPGRPGVPAYGSKLYRLGPVGISVRRKLRGFDVVAAVERKARSNKLRFNNELLQEKSRRFLDGLHDASFGALVTDYDGTILPMSVRNGPLPEGCRRVLTRLLKAGIPVFLATGRGDSIQKVLKDAFPKTLWPLIRVGYLNGAFNLPLDQADLFNQNLERGKLPAGLEASLRENPAFGTHVPIKNKKWQISIEPARWEDVDELAARIQEHLARLGDDSLRMVTSSHSIDILPTSVSKNACLKLANQFLRPPLQVLAIGDCGAYPGNDFELLQHPFSLSVDAVSTHVDSCWNFLPKGVSHARGTEFYLAHLEIGAGSFKIRNS